MEELLSMVEDVCHKLLQLLLLRKLVYKVCLDQAAKLSLPLLGRYLHQGWVERLKLALDPLWNRLRYLNCHCPELKEGLQVILNLEKLMERSLLDVEQLLSLVDGGSHEFHVVKLLLQVLKSIVDFLNFVDVKALV